MSEVSVASTTDDISAVQAAVDATNAELEGAAMVAPVEAATPEDAGRTEENQEETAQHEVRHRPRTSVQKRLAKITAQKYQLAEEKEQALREVRELREKLAAYEGRPQAKPESQREPVRDTEPAHEARQESPAQEIPDAEHLTANLSRHAERLADAYRRNPELLELANVDMPIRPDISAAILEEESSAELVIYLAKHPQEVEQLNDMPAWKAYQAISRLAGKLERASAGPRPVPRPKPQPIRPVGGSSTQSNVPLDEMSYADYRRHREAQERSSRRR